MRVQSLVLSFLVLTMGTLACDDKAPQEAAPQTATQTAKQVAAPKVPAVIGSDLAAMNDEAIAEMNKAGDVAKLRSYFAYQALRRGANSKDDKDVIEAVEVDNGKGGSRLIDHGIDLGVGRARGILLLMAAAGSADGPCDAACKETRLNGLFQPLAGKPLFLGSAKMDPEALAQVLKAVAVAEDTKIAGVVAPVMYKAFRPTLAHHARAYKAINALGHDTVMAEYNEALKKSEDDPKSMLAFYRLFPNMNEIPKALGIPPSRRVAGLTGFWLRRMADGTAPMLAAELMKSIETFDKALFEELQR